MLPSPRTYVWTTVLACLCVWCLCVDADAHTRGNNMSGNAYILKHYRQHTTSLESYLSIFKLHNQTRKGAHAAPQTPGDWTG